MLWFSHLPVVCCTVFSDKTPASVKSASSRPADVLRYTRNHPRYSFNSPSLHLDWRRRRFPQITTFFFLFPGKLDEDEIFITGNWLSRISVANLRCVTQPMRPESTDPWQHWASWKDCFTGDLNDRWLKEQSATVVMINKQIFVCGAKQTNYNPYNLLHITAHLRNYL